MLDMSHIIPFDLFVTIALLALVFIAARKL